MYLNRLRSFMSLAISEAREASLCYEEVPVASVVVRGDNVLAVSANQVIRNCDPLAHAEIIVMRNSLSSLCSPCLRGCDMYVTLEPCPMCMFAIASSGISRVYFGAYNKIYSEKTFYNMSSSCGSFAFDSYGGIMEAECSQLLLDFFHDLR